MKPSNVFVIEKDADHDFAKLVDFGISKLRSQDDGQAPSANLTRTNSALGTPLYMSPEQARSPRDVDPRTDVYSVGAILYEMLCGRTPYTAESGEYTEILFKLFTTEPEPIRSLSPDVPEGLAAIVHRALQRDRNARFGSAAEMALALAPYADARSQEVMSRVLAVHGRSTRPPVSADLTPPTRDAPVGHEAAHAQTFATGPGDVPRAPRVPTDVGVTRESAGSTSSSSGSRKAWIGGFAAAAAAIGLAAGAVVVTRGHGATPDRPTAPGSTSAEAPGTPGPGRSVAPSSNLPSEGASSAIVDAPAVGLPPAPDAAVSAHSQVTPEPKAPPPRPPPSAATALPKQLGELILK
jgi:serine/threonine-protein kinase